MLNHGGKSRLEIRVRAGGQHLQTLRKSISCGSDVGHVGSEDVRITRISKQCDRVDFREKFMQQLYTLWSGSTDISGHTREVAVWSTETFDKTKLDRVSAHLEDDGDRFGRLLCSKC
jgi:hypothetical protein